VKLAKAQETKGKGIKEQSPKREEAGNGPVNVESIPEVTIKALRRARERELGATRNLRDR